MFMHFLLFDSFSSHSLLVFFLYFADSPRCKPGTEQTSIGAINMHSIPVKCEVDADPPDSVKFSWTYNNTRNVSPVSIQKATFLSLLVWVYQHGTHQLYFLQALHFELFFLKFHLIDLFNSAMCKQLRWTYSYEEIVHDP